MVLRQPLPIECRDTVTGNAFFNGCVDELTWFLEDKSAWAAGMAMSLAMIHVSFVSFDRLSLLNVPTNPSECKFMLRDCEFSSMSDNYV